MSTGIQISSGSSGISVGTTAVTSGTNGRVFFQAGGVVQQDGAFNWDNTNKRLGIGANATSPTAALFMRTNTIVANDIVTIQNGQYGNPIFRVRDNATASPSTIGSVYFSALIYGGDSGVTRRFDLGGFGLGASFGDSASNAVWENNQGNIGDGQGTSVIAVSSNLYVNQQTTKKYKFEAVTGNFGIGNVGSLGARLDIRAADGLSNLAFRVRNSVDTLDILQVRGDTRIIQNITANSATTYAGFNVAGENTDTYINAVVSGNQPMAVGFRARSGNAGNSIQMFSDNGNVSGVGSASTHIWHSSTGYMYFGNMGGNAIGFKFGASNGSTLSNSSGMLGMLIKSNVSSNQSIFTLGTYLGTTTSNPSSNYGGNTFFIANGTAPTLTEVDSFGLYSADITAGNAAPHFRTENGSIIKLYRETTAVGAATLVSGSGTTLTDTDTFDGYTLEQVVKALRNLGILA